MTPSTLDAISAPQGGDASLAMDLDRYVPAYLTWIANKLSRGASLRMAVLTPKGRHLHDQIMGMAQERERAFLSVLDEDEVEVLLGLMRRLHANLPAVEASTQAHVRERFPHAAAARPFKADETP